jgi:polyhydroxybutyrate depolymerase
LELRANNENGVPIENAGDYLDITCIEFQALMKLPYLILAINFFSLPVDGAETHTIIVNGVERSYLVYKPPSLSTNIRHPVLLDFHGGGGNAAGTEKSFGFDNIADIKKFIVVYPEGINKGWNDGRKDGKLHHTADDITFISQLVDKLIKEENADPARIYAAGISNGAFFSIYLASKLPGILKAIAAVCGNITEDYKDSFSLPKPVSLLLINGTGDPLVKYDGGAVVSERAGRGRSVSTAVTINKWLQADKITSLPVIEAIPDTDKDDGCTATTYTYNGGVDSTSVVLIKIENGGHTWPGGKQYLPKFLVGKICRDFNASEVIWDFFERHK